MPYIVQPGRTVLDGQTYVAGDAYPGAEGEHPELVADGAVSWVPDEEPTPEPTPVPEPEPEPVKAPEKKAAPKKAAPTKAVKK